MKRLTTTTCMVLLTLCAVTAHSQDQRSARSSLFQNLPAIINCTEAQLISLFTSAKGQIVSVPLSDNFTLAGSVTAKLVQYSNLQTTIIKLAAFKNTLFSLSKQTDQENNSTYVGRILNPLYADGFELKRNAAGNYRFTKIDIEKILVNCNQ